MDKNRIFQIPEHSRSVQKKDDEETPEMEHFETKRNGFRKELTRRQVEAIPHLIGAKSLEAGCRKAKISRVTLHRWLKSDHFKNQLATTRERIQQEAVERLKSAISGAVDSLISLSKSRAKNIQLRASQSILDFFLKIQQNQEIEARLSRLEAIVEGRFKNDKFPKPN